MGGGVSAEECSAMCRLNKAVSFSWTCHKGRSPKIFLYNLGGQTATARFLKYLSIILQILNKGKRFSSSLVVENHFFFFLRHFQNQSGMLLSVQRSLELGSFSHFLPRLVLREWERTLAKVPLFLLNSQVTCCILVLFIRAFKKQIKGSSNWTF